MKLACVFKSSPFSSSAVREGIDAVLAASTFCESDDIAIFFINDGVLNLMSHQQPQHFHQKDHVKMLKLLDLYEIESRYVEKESLALYQMTEMNLAIDCTIESLAQILNRLSEYEKVLTF